MCYEIVQINFDVEAIPDDKLADPENKSHADYGTRGLYPFSFPAEFLAEVAIEQMFVEYERILAGEATKMTQEERDTVVKMFEYPVGLVQIHTGELTLYRDAPRPDLNAFETSQLTKLTYGLADLRIADPSTSTGLVTVHDRLESSFGMSLVGLSGEQIIELTDRYIGAAFDPETNADELDKVIEDIAAAIKSAIEAKLGPDSVFVGTESATPNDEPENPFGGLKLRG